MNFIIKLIASFFFTGYFPAASGTAASLLSVIIYYYLRMSPFVYLPFVFFLFLSGFAFSGRAQVLFQKKDSEKIVIDEAASMSLVCMFTKGDYLLLACGFLFFRFFDIIKPPPIKRIEKISGPKAVMLDDIAAALYAILLVLLVYRLQQAGILPAVSIGARPA
ncbi:MAG: phosphatidylglycerophosphatase A [Candidatus Omnitrophica bacterium]|nr:phosphatidylglycerophosphatase A [Candidatus Omnitrophota bacterium]